MEGTSAQTAIALLDQVLEPYRAQIGKDFARYRNHCARTLVLAESVAQPAGVWDPVLFGVAAAFHDIGLWTAGTWDYLDPSVAAMREAFASHRLPPAVTADHIARAETLIRDHHGVRARPSMDAAEAFRQADWAEVTLGLRHFAIPESALCQSLRDFPRLGFIGMLTRRFLGRMVTKPWSPLPMFRW